ncbi:Negative transcriptional regulator-copper transport operon [Streptococcus sp. DD10]|uniref:CopY/TcrY family copper transport repressor n=1 Tax=Streptococcus sp. DD10 TaxID=1777878 RepID=UPI000793924F|nr:CopY/TcrY family copper transport repressor [Streptococcus sp. DD10]KXT72484.1 Negative transcriptional regulator-copper transport operon [Streptococcus sp. DD10]
MQISNAEWQVMKIIWMRGQQTSSDLIEVLESRFSWSKSTVKTLLTRLVEKECLSREKNGKSFIYRAILSQDESTKLVMEDVREKVCSRKLKEVLRELIVTSDMTLSDIEGLQAVLEEKKAQAVETVSCNCM